VLGLAGALARTTAAPLLLVTPALETAGRAQASGPDAVPLPRIGLPEAPSLPQLLALLDTWNAQGLILAADSGFAQAAAVEHLLTEGRCALLLAR
jgi:hypothetical protein